MRESNPEKYLHPSESSWRSYSRNFSHITGPEGSVTLSNFSLSWTRSIQFSVSSRYIIYYPLSDSDSLQPGRSGDRIPVEARFSAPVQTGPGAYPASYTMGTGFFPGVKWSGRGVDHPPQYSAEVKKSEYSYTSTPPLDLRGLLQGVLFLYIYYPFFLRRYYQNFPEWSLVGYLEILDTSDIISLQLPL